MGLPFLVEPSHVYHCSWPCLLPCVCCDSAIQLHMFYFQLFGIVLCLPQVTLLLISCRLSSLCKLVVFYVPRSVLLYMFLRPFATSVNRFYCISSDLETGNQKLIKTSATTTNSLVAFGWVQSSFGHFFSPCNQTCKHYPAPPFLTMTGE